MELSVIVVNYNTRKYLDECLESLSPQLRDKNAEVIIVDNGSSDGSAEMVRQKHAAVRWIQNPQNVGFAAAMNAGFRASKGTYVLLLNSDTRVLSDACQATVQFMKKQESCAIAGCMLVDSQGSLQPSVRSFPSVMNVVSETFFLYKLFPSSNIFGRYYRSTFDYTTASPVDWVMGAFLLIRREVFESVGLLDEKFFMFAEEVDFCYRAHRAGFQTWFYPGARVVHHGAGSSVDGYRRILWIKGSQLLFFEKHFSGFERPLLYVLLLLGMILRIPVYALQSLVLLRKDYARKAFSYAVAAISLPFQFVLGSLYPRSGTGS